MSFFATLKNNARHALRGNWQKAIAILFIEGLLYFVLMAVYFVAVFVFVGNPFSPVATRNPSVTVSDIHPAMFIIWGVLSFLSLFLAFPLKLGVIGWYKNIVDGVCEPVGDIFRFFESARLYFRAVWYGVNIFVRTTLWSILFLGLPGGIYGVALYFLSSGDNKYSHIATIGLICSVVLYILAIIFYSAFINRYFVAVYLLCDDEPSLSVGKAIKASVAYSKGYRFSLLWYQLSFIGWCLLSVLVLPLTLYVAPYVSSSYAMYARYIIEKNRQIEQSSTKEFSVEDIAPQDYSPEQESQHTILPSDQPVDDVNPPEEPYDGNNS